MPEKKLATSDLWKMQVSSGITIKTVISPNHFLITANPLAKRKTIEKKSRAEKSIEKVMDTFIKYQHEAVLKNMRKNVGRRN